MKNVIIIGEQNAFAISQYLHHNKQGFGLRNIVYNTGVSESITVAYLHLLEDHKLLRFENQRYALTNEGRLAFERRQGASE